MIKLFRMIFVVVRIIFLSFFYAQFFVTFILFRYIFSTNYAYSHIIIDIMCTHLITLACKSLENSCVEEHPHSFRLVVLLIATHFHLLLSLSRNYRLHFCTIFFILTVMLCQIQWCALIYASTIDKRFFCI